MKKRVIILGAGAARFYGGPSTEELTRKVKTIPGAKYVEKQLHKCNPHGTLNFEYIIEGLRLEYEYYLNKNGRYCQSLLECLFKPKRKFGRLQFQKAYKASLDIVCYEIIKSIEGRKTENDSAFVNYINSFEGANKIYSLNYDRIPRTILCDRGLSVYEGADLNGKYEYDLEKFSNSPLSFYNLHGSVYLRGNSFCLGEVFLEEQHRRMLGLDLFSDDTYYFTPVITGMRKVDYVEREPYIFGQVALSLDLAKADQIDIIGYSFGDRHINTKLVKFKANRDVGIRVIGFCNDPESYDDKVGLTSIEKEQKKWCFFRNDMSSSPQPKGDGWYWDKCNRVSFYSKGVEEFLRAF